MVEKIENEVISKHGMNRKDYEASFSKNVKSNDELKKIEEYMINTLNKAAMGVLTLPKGPIPEVLSPLKVFELMVNFEKKKVIQVFGVLVEYIKQGKAPNEADPEFAAKMEEAMKGSFEMKELDELEIDDSEHHKMAYFLQAQNQYLLRNTNGFKIGYQQLTMSI